MKLSLEWSKSLGYRQEHSKEEIANLVGSRLGAIESVDDQGQRYSGAVVVLVVSVEKHSDADKLSVCKIDDAGVVGADVSRDQDGLVQVVCGAPNVTSGMLAVWLPPGSIVPETYGDDEFRLDARSVRGVKSYGMLASEKELMLSTNHEGIMDVSSIESATQGQKLADLVGLNDYVVDIENKMLTNRPDCFGAIGLARELSAITGQPFVSPEWYLDPNIESIESTRQLPLELGEIDPGLCRYYSAVAFDDVSVQESPMWLKSKLRTMGQKSINNIVDLTNYVMLLTAQPVHAFDHDKLSELGLVELGVRLSRRGESITLLDGKKVDLQDDAPVVTSNDQPVALAGIMGGTATEVGESTKRVILESANFDKYALRRTSFNYGVFSEALTRFSKGPRPEMTSTAIAIFTAIMVQEGWGKLSGKVKQSRDLPRHDTSVRLSEVKLRSLLGYEIPAPEVLETMGMAEIKTSYDKGEFVFQVPFWRSDLQIAEDFVEEIARLRGFERSPALLPRVTMQPVGVDDILSLSFDLRNIFASLGAKETLLYSFLNKKTLSNAGLNPDLAFKISNALSPDLQVYRTSLLPGILSKIYGNIKAGNSIMAIFEVGATHRTDMISGDGLPQASNSLALCFAADAKFSDQLDHPFYIAKSYLVSAMQMLGFKSQELSFSEDTATAPKSLKQALKSMDSPTSVTINGTAIAVIGVPSEFASKSFKLPQICCSFELDVGSLFAIAQDRKRNPLPLFFKSLPSTSKDLTIVIDAKDSILDLLRTADSICQRSEDVTIKYQVADIYQPDGSTEKNITLNFQLHPSDKTLSAEQANNWLNDVRARFDALDVVTRLL